MNRRRDFAAFVVLFSVLVALTPADAAGERLPARKYTTADGLINDYIVQIYCDSRGFLWFSTRDGLSRFDGVRFTTYGSADGLPPGAINAVLETRSGTHWIATNGGGVYQFNPRGRRPHAAATSKAGDPIFQPFHVGSERATNRVNAMVEDRAGDVWIGTDGGLFRMRSIGGRVTFERSDLSVHARGDFGLISVSSLVEDGDGSLWIGGSWGLSRRLPDGRLVRYSIEPADARNLVGALALGNQRDLWVGYHSGVMVLDTKPAATFKTPGHIVRTLSGPVARLPRADEGSTPDVERARWLTVDDGLPTGVVTGVFRQNDGTIWIGTNRGAAVYDGHRLRSYTTANGLPDNYLTTMAGDRAGNVWIGSVAGASRLIPYGLITYDETDGLPRTRIHWLGQGLSDDVFVVSGDYMVSQFDGKRFRTMRPQLPRDARCTWMSPCGFLDHAGEWWLPTTIGVYRYPRMTAISELLQPRAVYTSSTGLPTDNAFKIYEDRHGNVWIATAPDGLAQWQRSTAVWKSYTVADGMPPSQGTASLASAFAEDRAGNVWIGFYDGGLGRVRHGRIELFGVEDGAPAGLVTAIHRDAAGRLWIATNQSGLTRLDNAETDEPAFTPLPSNAHMASTNVRCLVEDDRGRIYAGTSRGIDRVDPATGRVEHFGAGEGLASEFVSAAFRDKRGALWFGTMSGVSRLDASANISAAHDAGPAPVLISSLRVRGQPQPVSELGDTAPQALTLAPDQNQLEIGFFSLTLRAGELVKYQFRIDPLDSDWSTPTDVPHVNYGRLPAGSHRFLVRSIRSDGAVSDPAVVAFTVLPPIYARWWFISAIALMLGGAAFTLYRIRIAQLLRVEKVRARIATDLHDDIGASLSQIAILAEVAQTQKPTERDPAAPLARIAETSRGLVDSMSDIVWAINPQVDSLSDLVHRMRRFAEDTLGAADIALTFPEPALDQDPRLGPEIRREIFLILKESVTNIAKHSGCTRVAIELESDRRWLHLRITDDGRGFDPAQPTDGNGLANMRRRVATFGGRLTIQSREGGGTTIALEVRL